MHRDQAVAACRGVHEGRTEAGLELVEATSQGDQRRVHCRMRRVVAEQARLDEAAGGRRLATLRHEEDQRRLLLVQSNVTVSDFHRPPNRVELQLAESIPPR